MGWNRKPRWGKGPTREWVRGQPVVEENVRYEKYYMDQGVCANEAEMAAMMASFRTPLPVSFRVGSATDLKRAVLSEIREQKAVLENGVIDFPRPLPWYPAGLAFQWEVVARKAMRRSPAMAEIKKYLVTENEMGAITRQEGVSMIPPLCLDVNGNSSVLDMCAAPGSKTSQMIDLSVLAALGDNILEMSFPDEVAVVANDVNIARARMLRHQLQRQGHPGSAVVNCDASNYPKASQDTGLYDRVLADVLCSGDGTLRKNPDVWSKWTPRGGLQLHPRQLQILLRGLELLAPQGRLVYSTCSLNPIEDEAVVAAALLAGNGRYQLLPLPALEGLIWSPGLTTWKVPNVRAYEAKICDQETETTIQSMQDFQDLVKKGVYKPGLVEESMFADRYSEEIREQLSKCGRFLPHQNNSGGFFVSVFENVAVEPSYKKNRFQQLDPERPPASDLTQAGDEFFRPRVLTLEDEDVKGIVSFYGMIPGVEYGPLPDTRMVKNSCPQTSSVPFNFTDPRTTIRSITDFRRLPLLSKEDVDSRIYLVTSRLLDLALSLRQPVRPLQYGVKAFDRMDDKFASASGCPFRPMMEAAPWLIPFMRRRVIFVTYKTMEKVMESDLNSHDLLTLEAKGSIANLDSFRRQRLDAEGAWLEPGGGYAVCCDEFERLAEGESARQLGILRIPCLLSHAGNMQTLVKKQVKDSILLHLSGGNVATFAENTPINTVSETFDTESTDKSLP